MSVSDLSVEDGGDGRLKFVGFAWGCATTFTLQPGVGLGGGGGGGGGGNNTGNTGNTGAIVGPVSGAGENINGPFTIAGILPVGTPAAPAKCSLVINNRHGDWPMDLMWDGALVPIFSF